MRKRKSQATHTAATLNYHGINIYQAAHQGNLPICVLLWGMASSKRVSLMVPDAEGNNPMHFAAQAEHPEVLGFFLQQTRGVTDQLRLVDTRNHKGETPLLRAMSTGSIPVVKALIDDSSDPLVIDYSGNNVFTALAKSCHLWCLNYVYQVVCNNYGPQVALELMAAPDNEAHCALDWAADAGSVNVLEFLMRRGLSPYRLDPQDRSALSWAVRSSRVDAARYLVKCGCDPHQPEKAEGGQSPLQLAQAAGNPALVAALSAPGELATARREQYKAQMAEAGVSELDSAHIGSSIASPPQYSILGEGGFRVSHAIGVGKHDSSLSRAILLGLIVFLAWLLLLCIPFYAWIFLISSSLLTFSHLKERRRKGRTVVVGGGGGWARPTP